MIQEYFRINHNSIIQFSMILIQFQFSSIYIPQSKQKPILLLQLLTRIFKPIAHFKNPFIILNKHLYPLIHLNEHI